MASISAAMNAIAYRWFVKKARYGARESAVINGKAAVVVAES